MSHALAVSRHAPLLRTSLTERLAATRAALARVSRTPAPSQVRAELLAAYAEQRSCMPLFDLTNDSDTPDYRAGLRVETCRTTARRRGCGSAWAPPWSTGSGSGWSGVPRR